jgi:hypothetical protein
VLKSERWRFMFDGYNAGEGTIFRAQGVARVARLDERVRPSIESVAPRVTRWHWRETIAYVRRIAENRESLR